MEALRVDKPLRVIGVARLNLLVQIELFGVRSEPNINLQLLLIVESSRISLSDVGVIGHTADFHAGIDRPHVGDQHAVVSSSVRDVQSKTDSAFGMAEMVVNRELRASERDLVTVSETLVDP